VPWQVSSSAEKLMLYQVTPNDTWLQWVPTSPSGSIVMIWLPAQLYVM